VLELSRARASIVLCLGRRQALDGLQAPEGALACRIAPDELMLVSLAAPLQAEPVAAELEPGGGLAVDQSDAFAVWTLSGDAAAEAFARLSSVELPVGETGLAQGTVAGVPARAIVELGRIHVLVSSALAHHLRERVRAACGDLELREQGA
jgi:sarcosine oxidase gamma subunit